MSLKNRVIEFLCALSLCVSCVCAATCEETATSQVNVELAKQNINNAKALYPQCQEDVDKGNCTKKDKSLGHLNSALHLLEEAQNLCPTCRKPEVVILNERPVDCSDIQAMGNTKSGVYQVYPRGRGLDTKDAIDVYCDMGTDGGGWTVIQRRGTFSKQIDFYRDWQAYKEGFGDITEEFWMGNEKIFTLTNQRVYQVRFDLKDGDGEYRYATYDSFYIGDEYSAYVLHIYNHSGNATDDLQYHTNMMFSTKDRQNDRKAATEACARTYHGAFWYTSSCGYANLNGVLLPGVKDVTSVWWWYWKGYVGLSSVEIKIRRRYL